MSEGSQTKKSKKDKVSSVEGAAPVAAEASKKEKKKDKKRKAETEATVESAAPSTTASASGDVDIDEEERKRLKKKAKKEKKAAATAALAAASTETSAAAPSESAPTKKEKKDKKSSTDEPLAAPVASATIIPTLSPAESTAYLTKHKITLSHPYTPLVSFESLPVDARLKPTWASFKEPSPIQACSWPPLFEGKDVVGIAETGSGKTLGFGVPAMKYLLSNQTSPKSKTPSPQILIISPTRELALQTSSTLTALCQLLGFSSTCLFGGVPKPAQVAELRKPNLKVVVGTPGRVMDLVNDGAVSFENVGYLVLDEADRMLDKGFENDIRKIIGYCTLAKRQTLMFSATWPDSVKSLAATFMQNPVKITVGSEELSANARVEQNVEVFDTSRDKDPRLLSLLRSHKKSHPSGTALRILVFALYKKEASRLEQTIRRQGFKVSGLHGDMGQNERMRALEGFVSGEVEILVATDVAARGLDIPDVSLVINVTFPLTVEDYIHRIGRTGRGGKSGKSVTFFTGENHETSLAGEFMRVLRDGGVEIPKAMDRFPSTIKKKEHGSYGAFFKDISDAPAAKKIKFD